MAFILSLDNFFKGKEILKSKQSKKFSKIADVFDLKFLFFLFAGILSAIILGSRGISFLLENYFISLLSFFVGLIFASSLIIYKHISIHSLKNFFLGLVKISPLNATADAVLSSVRVNPLFGKQDENWPV